jgi:hypothetical protein
MSRLRFEINGFNRFGMSILPSQFGLEWPSSPQSPLRDKITELFDYLVG